MFVIESFPSRNVVLGDKPGHEYRYQVIGTDNKDLAMAMIMAFTEATDYDVTLGCTLFRDDVHGDQVAPDVYDFTVKYGPRKPPAPGDWSFSFDCSGGTQHITQAKVHINDYAPPAKTAPDFDGAIGVGDDGQPAGCDVVSPVYNWTENWQMAAAYVNDAYKAAVAALVGHTNQAIFRGFAAREVLFSGAAGSISSKNPAAADLTFKFSAKKHETGQTIGTITGVAVEAWEYAWVRYEQQKHAGSGKMIAVPSSVHVERVYWPGDFTVLGIGS